MLACTIGLETKYFVLTLSQYKIGLFVACILNSDNKDCNHKTSIEANTKALYFALVEDLTTIFCLPTLQETKLSPK